ncbi:predicted protein [Postia placenta Mad-698-R]|uniref:Uncharacterized protein n=1 Tax=Postia placenta MAD-698-R-SB12 TaxID=670580 RepID=A0A1X6NC11_9APHY|nr:hypothetical protein POSPLADRAFT_1131992 [Postia placenta MAD-698-R-SB12]EED77968.1 predicted protein [Postia placenta Mad-698-R]OSX66042.1 hypothetical protein POSPLADRAFT_1131992 [Postia placenta MAD-698-R-SB12]
MTVVKAMSEDEHNTHPHDVTFPTMLTLGRNGSSTSFNIAKQSRQGRRKHQPTSSTATEGAFIARENSRPATVTEALKPSEGEACDPSEARQIEDTETWPASLDDDVRVKSIHLPSCSPNSEPVDVHLFPGERRCGRHQVWNGDRLTLLMPLVPAPIDARNLLLLRLSGVNATGHSPPSMLTRTKKSSTTVIWTSRGFLKGCEMATQAPTRGHRKRRLFVPHAASNSSSSIFMVLLPVTPQPLEDHTLSTYHLCTACIAISNLMDGALEYGVPGRYCMRTFGDVGNFNPQTRGDLACVFDTGSRTTNRITHPAKPQQLNAYWTTGAYLLALNLIVPCPTTGNRAPECVLSFEAGGQCHEGSLEAALDAIAPHTMHAFGSRERRPLTMLLPTSRRGDRLKYHKFVAYYLLLRHSEMRFAERNQWGHKQKSAAATRIYVYLRRRERAGADPEYRCFCLMLCRPCDVCTPSTSIARNWVLRIARASKEASSAMRATPASKTELPTHCEDLHAMVSPFPNEIWLDIFHGLAKEGEYDVLERCRVACKGFEPMARECLEESMRFENVEEARRIKVDVSGGGLRRWGGPVSVYIEGADWKDGRGPIPHLATFASRFAGRWTRVKNLWIYNAVWRARDLNLDTIVRDLTAFAITRLCLSNVTLPSILTIGRLVCALPRLEMLSLGDVQFTQHPLDAFTISRFHLLPHTQLEILHLDNGGNDAKLRPSFVELVDLMAAVSNRKCLVPPPNFAQASPWSAVRRLILGHVTSPSVTSFARLLCALPSLESIDLRESYAFVKHGFDPRSVPVHPGLLSHLVNVDLAYDFLLRSDPFSVADLVDFFIASGLSENLRRIIAYLSSSPRATTACDAALERLVKHSKSLRHLFLRASPDADVRVHVDHSAAPYFDVSNNTCLEPLHLTVEVDHENISHPCALVVAILSQVTSTHISRIDLAFQPRYYPGPRLDVDVGRLMDGLPQLDSVLSRPIFSNLTDVIVHIMTLDGPSARDAESVRDLRLCLPMLDARGILGFMLNNVKSGLHQDMETGEWRSHKIERVSAQDAGVTNAGAGADDDRRTDNATTVTIPHDDSDVVSGTSQPVWVPSAVYADAQTPSLLNYTDAQVPAELACNDEFLLQTATVGLGASVDKIVPDDNGVDDKLSAEPGTLESH